jgi:hypothetical protein
MIRRRTLIAAALMSGSAGAVSAEAPAASAPAVVNLPPVGLPVIEGGRVRNYVFVQARLHLAAGRNAETVRVKIPHFRDALVRAGHRTPFVVPGNWVTLNAAAIATSLMRAAPGIVGAATLARVEITDQSPRRRISPRAA